MRKRIELARLAAVEALKLRKEHGLEFSQAISVYDLAENGLGISVYFDRIASMEGMYFDESPPRIFLSSLRPPGRMAYTCAHEIGHHVFRHGARVDEYVEHIRIHGATADEEYVAERFAGFLLMPKLAVSHGFANRRWDPAQCGAQEIYTVACWLGVGYSTLISHMEYTLKMLPSERAERLVKAPLRDVRRNALGQDGGRHLVVVDQQWFGRPIDLHVGDLVLFKHGVEHDANCLEEMRTEVQGRLFQAVAPGIGRVLSPKAQWAEFVRVSRDEYVGQCRYRHLEEPVDEHEK